MRYESLRSLILYPLPERIFGLVSVTMVAGIVMTVGLWAVDARTIDGGISIWAKPLKFELALALHAGTLAIVVARLGPQHRASAVMQAVAVVFLAACIVEMGWIIAQAAQGRHSHFNDSTALDRAMFTAMAACAAIITGTAGAVALIVWRDKAYSAAAPAKAGIVLGLMGGMVLTLVTAFAIGGRGGPYIGDVPPIDARMLFTGWSRIGGDLRVAHFLATHMIQAVPIVAIFTTLSAPKRAAMPLVVCFAALWAAWTLFEFQRALGGGSLFPVVLGAPMSSAFVVHGDNLSLSLPAIRASFPDLPLACRK